MQGLDLGDGLAYSIAMLKKYQWILLPVCLIVGILLLFSFVKISQGYLSEYLVENSKSFLGQKLDLKSVAEHLGDTGLAEFAKSPKDVPVILVFWSSTCIPCLEELPHLEEKNPGALIVPINADMPEMLEDAQATFARLAPRFSFRHDGEQFLQKSLKINYLPTHVILDSQGFIKQFQSGRK